MWSGLDNWSSGVPTTGMNVLTDRDSTDDLSSLSLGYLDVGGGHTLEVTGELSVTTFDYTYGSGGTLISDGGNVTIGSASGPLIAEEWRHFADYLYGRRQRRDRIESTPSSYSTVNFDAGTLVLEGALPGDIDASLVNFGLLDAIGVPGAPGSPPAVSWGAHSFSITTSDGTFAFDSVQYQNGAVPTDFYTEYANGLVYIAVDAVACYLKGTKILTGSGEVPIERLRIGDRVRTKDGALKPIKWIGRRSYDGRFAANNWEVLPVLILAGALAPATPRRNLYVSPRHAMFIDGMLISAADLVNGTSVLQIESMDRIDYLHIELEEHDAVYAEGALSETFVNDDSRMLFQNAHEYEALYPDEVPVSPLFCAPRFSEGFELQAIRDRLTQGAQRGGSIVSAPLPRSA